MGSRRDTLLNWGRSYLQVGRAKVINKPEAVALATNKLKTFQHLKAQGFEDIPEWTTLSEEALTWIQSGNKVYCRTQLTGRSGSGIVIAETPEDMVNAPLYTKNVKHKYEFRIHVMNGEVIDEQQKKKRTNWDGPSTNGIRNYANGWIFARSDIIIPDVVSSAAINAVALLGLDFGALDIGYNETQNKAYVFEVNTAPGIEGTTLTKYVEAIRRFYYE